MRPRNNAIQATRCHTIISLTIGNERTPEHRHPTSIRGQDISRPTSKTATQVRDNAVESAKYVCRGCRLYAAVSHNRERSKVGWSDSRYATCAV